jgi:hypothetical protein
VTTILVRDDDANATTDPKRMERVYAPLLDAGVRISFAVIPEVALNTRAPDGSREAFLDQSWPDSESRARVSVFSPIAAWLRRNSASVDVLQHGLSHERLTGGTEFGGLTEQAAKARIAEGKAILTSALGKAPSGFVAPWDCLSRGSMVAATEAYDFVSTSWVSRQNLPTAAWPSHVLERLRRNHALRVGSSMVVRHRGGFIAPHTSPSDVPGLLARASSGGGVTVVVLHHWMFWDRSEPHPVVCALARSLRGRHTVAARELAPTG